MGSVRQLSAFLVANGSPWPVVSVDVDQTTTQGSDTFHATLAVNALGLAYWADANEVQCEVVVNAGADGGQLFTGSADSIDISFDTMTVKVSGRDKSKGPIETKSNEGFRNKTSSQIVSEVAGRHGLKPVIKSTSAKAGKKFKADWVALTDNVSEWTLVQHLADREGMVAFVQKNELHFQPLDDDSMGDVPAVFVPPTPAGHARGNVLKLAGSHNLQLAKKTSVKVHSWDTDQKEVVEGKKELGGSASGENAYVYRHAHLEKGQAKQIAEKRLREHTRHEMTVNLTMVGRASIAPRKRLLLSGTGTAFDQTYYIDNVRHSISGNGYVCDITAKNTKGGRR